MPNAEFKSDSGSQVVGDANRPTWEEVGMWGVSTTQNKQLVHAKVIRMVGARQIDCALKTTLHDF
jgi:hypothetical protein